VTLTIIFAVLLIFVLLGMILVAYQLNDFSHQLAFIDEENTRKEIQVQVRWRPLLRLARQLNVHLSNFYRRGQQAMQQERQVQETLAGLSHDIRTPITSLEGYLQLLEQTENETERQRYFKIMYLRLDSLSQILTQLFTYVKLQQEAYSLDLEAVNFTDLAAHSLFSFYEDFRQQDFNLSVDFPDAPLYVMGQVDALNRVLQNIFVNALHHGSGMVQVKLQSTEAEAVFLCSNGMAKDVHLEEDEVFRQFYKADPARGGSSTGLGLYIAKKLVEKMGGRLEVEIREQQFSLALALQLTQEP
jgi:signal transduction histidine kinase